PAASARPGPRAARPRAGRGSAAGSGAVLLRTRRAQRARGAPRTLGRAALAGAAAELAQQQVCALAQRGVLRQLRGGGGLRAAVARVVALPLRAIAQAQQRAQAVRPERQRRRRAREQQDLLGARPADRGELLQRLHRLRQRQREQRPLVAAVFLQQD